MQTLHVDQDFVLVNTHKGFTLKCISFLFIPFFCKNCFLIHHFYVSDTYKNNEYCYWSFYAPGAEKIILELTKMKTVPGDYMQVIGKGEVDYLVLEGEQVEAKNWTFESKYLQISWLTDDEDVSDGFTANIIRIG